MRQLFIGALVGDHGDKLGSMSMVSAIIWDEPGKPYVFDLSCRRLAR